MKKTVLIVEDNELNMKLFNDLLEANGYATKQSKNGLEAVDLAKLYLPDLILMDIQLPELSGLEAISLIKAEPSLKAIPIIAITAFAMRGDEEKILLSGCEGYISKPISVTNFLEAVNTFLKQDP
ncbi:response regulator [Methylocystaceae bacterium]|jgi:two-component system cell cycle response regulator DivK|nr:response regulator [Methylocystaceae bacterium]